MMAAFGVTVATPALRRPLLVVLSALTYPRETLVSVSPSSSPSTTTWSARTVGIVSAVPSYCFVKLFAVIVAFF